MKSLVSPKGKLTRSTTKLSKHIPVLLVHLPGLGGEPAEHNRHKNKSLEARIRGASKVQGHGCTDKNQNVHGHWDPVASHGKRSVHVFTHVVHAHKPEEILLLTDVVATCKIILVHVNFTKESLHEPEC